MPVAEPLAEPSAESNHDYVWTLNFGPQHPATHTTLRIVLKLDGERVIDAVPDIGYLHSGFEKTGEHLDYNQYVTITDRMNYISPVANGVAWHAAVEKLLDIEITPRCKYIRTIVTELARISDHLLCTGAMGLDTCAFTFFLYAFYQREVIYDIFETISGQRFHPSMTRVGGLAYDFTPLVIEKIRTFVKTFPQTLDDMERLLNRNRIFVDRTITHFEMVMTNRGFVVPNEETYAAIEAPNGELGFYVVGDGSDVAYRARTRPPSFIHFSLFPELIRGHTLSDVVAVLGSLN